MRGSARAHPLAICVCASPVHHKDVRLDRVTQASVSSSALGQILRHAYGFWASAALASSFRYRIFEHLAQGARDAETVASAAGISQRGCAALLDGLLGMGLITKASSGYANVVELEPYLLEGRPTYVGGYADAILATLADWSKLPEAVASGKPLHRRELVDPGSGFWENTVRGVAPVALGPARVAADKLQLATKGAFRALDIGGGAGAYAIEWLAVNAQGRVCQLDAAGVNAVARGYVAEFGHADRFETIDGDMELIELEPASFDFAIYSNVTHGLSAERNTAMFRRIRDWLKPGGTLVLSSMIPNDDRTGDPLLLLFSTNLLLNTVCGRTYLAGEYEAWLRASGFVNLETVPVAGSASTLILAS
jgi:ubiquinone/menaquinone biosynthesis C-methylase UbiE